MIPLEQIEARHVIFDLDGTLIDSAPAILASFAKAFECCGRTPVIPLTQTLIGPPLMQTLAGLAGTDSPSILEPLAEAFKTHYDQVGYRLTRAYPGINDLLASLSHQGCTLHIATNKRILPTRLILALLDWPDWFTTVYALDSVSPAVSTKSDLLDRLLKAQQIDPADAIYIGDRREDEEAAKATGLKFMMAVWGYQDLSNS